jgi:hypothetical protein
MSSSYLNQIFYDYNKFDTKESILLLEPYMYNKSDIPNIQPISKEIPKSIISSEILKKEINNIKPPKEISDPSFFWCLYINHFGYDEFLKIGKKYKNIELEERVKMIDFIKQKPHKIKDSNIKITKIKTQEILSDLMSGQVISIFSYPIICLYYNISVYIVINKTYLYFGVSDSESKNVILHFKPSLHLCTSKTPTLSADLTGKGNSYHALEKCEGVKRGKSGIFVIESDVTDEKINKIKEELVCLESHDKPFKSISNYKVDDLENIAKKLGIFDITKKTKKDELFNLICQSIHPLTFYT